MKISELTGAALDWAVAKCEEPIGGYKAWVQDDLTKGVLHGMDYSTDWQWGGEIIEREEIAIQCCYTDGELDGWMADSKKLNDDEDMEQYGPTPLIAAMRCFVASRLGDEIELPETLI